MIVEWLVFRLRTVLFLYSDHKNIKSLLIRVTSDEFPHISSFMPRSCIFELYEDNRTVLCLTLYWNWLFTSKYIKL